MTDAAKTLDLTDAEGDGIFVTVPIVARVRDCTPRTVERAVASGRLPSVRTNPGGRRLIAVRDIREWKGQ